jgi:hypothetical protein
MKRILVLIVAISAIAVFAGHVFGQVNTGSAPYRDSEHTYEISIGKESNRREWILTDGTTSYNLTTSPQTWASIAAVSDGKQRIAIFFDRTVFTTDNWNLRYFEYDKVGAGERCTSARQFAITLVNNSFVLALDDDFATCNSQSGRPHTYEEVDTESFNTTVIYTVTMAKDNDFKPTFWKFDAQFSQSVQSITVNSTTTNPGTISYTPATVPGTDYTIQVNPVAASPASVVLNIEVQFSNTVHTAVTPTLTVSNGLAVVQNPPNPDMDTQDNITVVDGDPVRTQIITINAIPESRNIEANAALGEADWSARNPLQNSTHNYRVQMGNTANTVLWRILNSDNTILPNAGNVAYELTPSGPTGGYALAQIRYKMPAGSYVLEYTETAGTCSSVRRYDVNVLGPFDVDIAAATNQCAGISTQINNLTAADVTNGVAVHETTTTVDYIVNLVTNNYQGDWEFQFALTGDPVFDPTSTPVSDLEVQSITTTTAGANYNEGLIEVTNTELTPVTQVVVRVVYNGVYQLAHNITATLSNITGSYAEQDADGTNNTTHTIYAMPQAGTLAGVD